MAKEIEFIFALRKLADAREENVVKLYVDEANLFLNTLSYYMEMEQEKAWRIVFKELAPIAEQDSLQFLFNISVAFSNLSFIF